MAYPVPDPYKDAIRGNIGLTYVIDAWFGGSPVAGAQALPVVSGSITDTTKPGVRRNLSCEIAPEPGLYELLSPLGTQLKVYAKVTYTNRNTATIPMGVFVVGEASIKTGGGSISVTAPDKWVLIQRAKFIGPASSSVGSSITGQIASLITGALPGETVTITATTSANVGALAWEQDREKAILDMAASAAVWVYFDRNGAPVIANMPTPGPTADWLVDASSTGVLLNLDRSISASDVFNVIVVTSTAADGEKFPPQVAFDSAPGSPTYAGTDPFTNPASAGPFGISVKYLDTPTGTDAAGALAAARAELARSIGLAAQASLEQVPNPALDAYDVIDVAPLGSQQSITAPTSGAGFGTGGFGTMPFGSAEAAGVPTVQFDPALVERYVADTVTHPLTPGGNQGQQIDARKVISA